MLTNDQFEKARQLALRLAGIELFERHRELLHRRLLRMGLNPPAGFDALLAGVEAGNPAASMRFVGLITTKFTGFFRQPCHFEIAAEHALWAVHRRGRARLWSAAAATGEEPYSLAVALLEIFRHDRPPVAIVATDIDEAALAVAQRGEYNEAALSALTPERRLRFAGERHGATHWSLSPSVRQLVEFHGLNLIDSVWAIEGFFDVILCRNVLMYLEGCHRYSVLERLASLLAPDGLLMLDPTEHLGRAVHFFAPGKDGVYARRRAADPRRDRPRHSTSSRVEL